MEQLRNAFGKLSVPADEATLSKFEEYMRMVLSWNEKVNLTAITDRGDFVRKHFIDSLLCTGFPEVVNADEIVDVGTGAGFPGVPLALVFQNKRISLIDAANKKVRILSEIVSALGLTNVSLICGRAEELARRAEHREKFDVCVSRAVANLSTLSEYCLPFVKVGGAFISYKGQSADDELAEAAGAIMELGGGNAEARRPHMEEFGMNHSLIVVRKIAPTPDKYPRRPGLPAKDPLK